MSDIYDEAEAYEVAFSYRDIAAEVDTLLAWRRRASRGSAERREAAGVR